MLNIMMIGINDGLLWAILALGLYISYRVLDIADLTCEGSITLGASVVTSLLTAMMANSALADAAADNLVLQMLLSLLCILVSSLAGVVAGVVTGVLYTKFKIPPILAGILTMCSLFTVNLWLMDGASLALPHSFYNALLALCKNGGIRLSLTSLQLIVNLPLCALLVAVLYWFFGTELGAAIRATGNNPQMCRAQGINTDLTTIVGLGIGNGLVALSGALQVQTRFNSEVNMGVGAIVIGLAAIVIGEALFSRFKNFGITMAGIVLGSVIYRVIVSVVIDRFNPNALKLVSALIVVLALTLPRLVAYIQKRIKDMKKKAPKAPEAEAPEAPAEAPVTEEVSENE